jgi:hypothetical protein
MQEIITLALGAGLVFATGFAIGYEAADRRAYARWQAERDARARRRQQQKSDEAEAEAEEWWKNEDWWKK